MTEPLFVLAVLCALVALSERLARLRGLRALGSALIVIVVTAIVANLGVIPVGGGAPVYGVLLDEVVAFGVFCLLLQVDLRRLFGAGLPLLGLFVLGALGTVAGVVAGMTVVGGAAAFGDLHFALAGMFTGTYVGGSVNFNAVAAAYDVPSLRPALFAGANAVDAAMTAVWMAVTVVLPRWLGRGVRPASLVGVAAHEEQASMTLTDLAVTLALGAGAVVGSRQLSAWCARSLGADVPAMLVLTTVALLLAQLPCAGRLRGARLLGMFAVYLFLAVIGAMCDVAAVIEIGRLAGALALFVTVIFVVHGAVVFGAAGLLRIDAVTAAVASQANVGGATSALALARTLGRNDLVLPAILIGSLGTALGNYLGFLVAAMLR